MENYIGIYNTEEVQTYCLMSDGVVVKTGQFTNEEEFKQEVDKLIEHYKAIKIEECDNFSITKKHKLINVPPLSKVIGDFLKTEKGKGELRKYLYENDAIDYKLVEELLNFRVKD